MSYTHPRLTRLHAGEQGMFDIAIQSRLLNDAAKDGLPELLALCNVIEATDAGREGLLNMLAWAFTSGVSYAVAQLGAAKTGDRPITESFLSRSGALDRPEKPKP